MQAPAQQRKILNPIIPQQPGQPSLIRDCEISYLNGVYFVRDVDANQDGLGDYKPIQPPCDIVSYVYSNTRLPQEEMSFKIQDESHVAYKREVSNNGQRNDNVERFSPEGDLSWKTGVAAAAQEARAFDWHNQRVKPLELPNYNMATRNFEFDAESQLDMGQKIYIRAASFDRIEEFKRSCSSLEEFRRSIHYLLTNENQPQFLLSSTQAEFDRIQETLTYSSLLKMELNSRATHRRGDNSRYHLATVGEAKQYMLLLLQQSLKNVDPDYPVIQVPLDETGNWGRLSPTSTERDYVAAANRTIEAAHDYGMEEYDTAMEEYNTAREQRAAATEQRDQPLDPEPIRPPAPQLLPDPEDVPPSNELRDFVRTNLRAISNVLKLPTLDLAVQAADTQEEIEAAVKNLGDADRAITAICERTKNAPMNRPERRFNEGDAKYIAGHLFHLISKDLINAIPNESNFQTAILIPTQAKIRAKIRELQPNVDLPPLPANLAPAAPIHPEEVIRPLPQQNEPQQPQGVQVGFKLLKFGMPEKIINWYKNPENGGVDLFHDTVNQTLSGSVNGTEIVMYDDKILLHKASGEDFTDEELKDSIRDIVKMLKDTHPVGTMPKLTALGNDHQKRLICEVYEEMQVPYQQPVYKTDEDEDDDDLGQRAGFRNRR